jgi:hypothetical protein
MHSLAFEAVIKFSRNYLADNECKYEIKIFSYEASNKLDEFVDKSYDYVEKLTKSYR